MRIGAVIACGGHACPPLAQERKLREKAGIPLRSISAQGYFLPADQAVPASASSVADANAAVERLARMPGGPERIPFHGWLVEECIDHLLPWNGKSLRERPALRALGLGLAVAATLAWALSASGQPGSTALIGGWVGWSFYELLCRERCKPWVKQGPWWGRFRRPADRFDLLAYVATKNLLIGAVLFLLECAGMAAVNRSSMSPGMPPWLSWALLFLLSIPCAQAATWTVGPGQSIAVAVNKAAAGDTVQVQAGNYA